MTFSTAITILNSIATQLINANLLTREAALHAMQQAQQQQQLLTFYLVANQLVTSTDLAKVCAQLFDLPVTSIQATAILPLLDSQRIELIRRYRVIPLAEQNGILQLGITDPSNQDAIDAMRFYSGMQLSLHIVLEDELTFFIDTYCTPALQTKQYFESRDRSKHHPHTVKETLSSYEEPITQFVDEIIQQALQKSASDIHIEPYATQCRIRYRQDGVLYEIMEINQTLAARVQTRLKILADLDIAERRLPQDGRLRWQHGTSSLDIRLNTCPTIFGEKMVLRLLNNHALTLDALGLTNGQKVLLQQYLTAPQGLILVTGPTGSGKTVTLYSALHYVNNSSKNISTVEDPVEIQLDGINQVNIHPKIGLSFASVLRTLLRQDPDILMIGEIRDQETAEIALQAAQTGHLVLSTLHTNNAIEAITRLQSMHIKPQYFSHSLSLIIAQRLIRKLCPDCKQPTSVSTRIRQQFNIAADSILYAPQGCDRCLQGYRGRLGIYEFLPIPPTSLEMFAHESTINLLTERLVPKDFWSLRRAAIQRVIEGQTSLAEMHRVIS